MAMQQEPDLGISPENRVWNMVRTNVAPCIGSWNSCRWSSHCFLHRIPQNWKAFLAGKSQLLTPQTAGVGPKQFWIPPTWKNMGKWDIFLRQIHMISSPCRNQHTKGKLITDSLMRGGSINFVRLHLARFVGGMRLAPWAKEFENYSCYLLLPGFMLENWSRTPQTSGMM